MPYDIFSKRQKSSHGDTHDPMKYNELPHALRVQLIQIIDEFYTTYLSKDKCAEFSCAIVKILRREYGVWSLIKTLTSVKCWHEIMTFIETEPNVEKTLDGVELFLQFGENYFRNYIEQIGNNDNDRAIKYRQILDNILEEVNYRFLEHNIGYQYESGKINESGKIICMDSTYTHEITKSALQLLRSATFLNVNKEFLEGHEHYRHQRNRECVRSCGSALESTMKIICDEKKWKYSSSTAADLLQTCCNNFDLSIKREQFNLYQSLVHGVPQIRNLVSHGTGRDQVTISNCLARYALNLTATNIILLVELSGIK